MSFTVWRDFSRTEEDDFKLNVQPHLSERMVATPVRTHSMTSGYDVVQRDKPFIAFWKIHPMHE